MTEDNLKNEVRDLVEAAIAEGVTLRVASVKERILELHGDCDAFLVRYHIEQTARAMWDMPFLPIFDSDLKQEIAGHAEAELAVRPDDSISLDWVVGRVLTAHSRSGTRFRGPLIDPSWHGVCAVAGMKHLILDVLTDEWWPGELQTAYVVTRDGEETIVPSLQLTVDELRVIEDEDRKLEEECRAEFEEFLKERARRKAEGREI